MEDKRGMKEHIDKFLEMLPKMTKEEANFILQVINWDLEKQAAFRFAKMMFEEGEE